MRVAAFYFALASILRSHEAGQRIAIERTGLPGVRVPLTIGSADDFNRQPLDRGKETSEP
jgi:hypothetical protein